MQRVLTPHGAPVQTGQIKNILGDSMGKQNISLISLGWKIEIGCRVHDIKRANKYLLHQG